MHQYFETCSVGVGIAVLVPQEESEKVEVTAGDEASAGGFGDGVPSGMMLRGSVQASSGGMRPRHPGHCQASALCWMAVHAPHELKYRYFIPHDALCAFTEGSIPPRIGCG